MGEHGAANSSRRDSVRVCLCVCRTITSAANVVLGQIITTQPRYLDSASLGEIELSVDWLWSFLDKKV